MAPHSSPPSPSEAAATGGSPPADATRAPRFLVVGLGGIGGTILGGLLRQDAGVVGEVWGYTRNAEVARALRGRGAVLRGLSEPGELVAQVVESLPSAPGPFDFILLATQPTEVEAAAQDCLPLLAPDGALVVCPNGLCEERVARLVGEERVIGAVVTWGATHPEPGVFERTSAGGFTIGRLSGVADERLERLSMALEAVGPVEISTNLRGARWSKLAINAAISTLGTISGERLGPLMKLRIARRLGLEIVTETVNVARAQGIHLEKLSGVVDLEWLALTPDDQEARSGSAGLVARHTLLLAVGTRYRRMRSSMLSAIERGRSPGVEFLNGEVVAAGARLGLPTPINTRAMEVVQAISRGEAHSGIPTLRALAAEFGFFPDDVALLGITSGTP